MSFPIFAQTSAMPPTQQTTTAYPDTAKRLDGRLFFSPQERQRMDNARKRGVMLSDTGQFTEAPPSVLNGFVKRSDGSTALWVDGNVRWNAQSKSAAGLVPSDVGGPAAYLKVISVDAAAPSKKPVARGKRQVKSRAKISTLPRLLP